MMRRTLVNLDPVNELRAMEEWFDRMFGATANQPASQLVSTMPVDITEHEGKLYIRASVAGINPDDLDISIEQNVLNIRGESKHEEEQKDTKVYRREISYGRVSRSIRLPEGLDLKAVDAEFKNGLVTISLPRLPEEKPAALKVSVRNAEGVKPIDVPANEQ